MVNRSLRLLAISLVVVGIFTILGLFFVWRHHRIVQLGAELGKATTEFKELTRENERLRTEYETLKMQGDLEDRARGDLKMEALDPKRVIVVPAEPRKVAPAEPLKENTPK